MIKWLIILCIVVFYILPLIYCKRHMREYYQELTFGDILWTITPLFNIATTIDIYSHQVDKDKINNFVERFFK